MYDVIIIGGGPAGIMAAIAAAEQQVKVLLIDKGDKLGRKLAISGGGRCNVTNRMPIDELVKHIPGNGRFLYSALSIFSNEDIISYFQRLGIPLKEEDRGRMFPVNDNAQHVVDVLLNRLETLNVTIMKNSPVKTINYYEGSFESIELLNGRIVKGTNVVVAVGGKSVPQTGSTGDGYSWAKKAGHTISDLYPTEVPIISNEAFIKEKLLQGLSLRDINLSVLNQKGKPIITHRWDIIFTHFGISGPAALRCSQYVVKELRKGKEVKMKIELFPDKNEEQVFHEIYKMGEADPKKSLKNVLKGYIPERYLLFLLQINRITQEMTFTSLKHAMLRELAKSIKGFEFSVNSTLPIEKAFVTGGGVSVKEISPKTMASKKVKGLYFAGEILDVHGYTGGYNITAAFVTGYIAGKNAANL